MRSNTLRFLAVLAITALLVGCGGSRESRAAAVCETAAKERSEGKLLAVDLKALELSAAREADDILRLQAPVTFDTGLQSEYTQTLNCRVQFSDDDMRVIGIVFVF